MHPWLHFKTITKHKLLVMKYCFGSDCISRGLLHDLSNIRLRNFWWAVNIIREQKPEQCRAEDIGFPLRGCIWGRNKHHFEHWVDYSLDKNHVIIGLRCHVNMWQRWLWTGSVLPRNYLGDAYTNSQPLEYFIKSKEDLLVYSSTDQKELEALLRILNDHGEKNFSIISNTDILREETRKIKY